METAVQMKVGRIMSAGAPLPKDARKPTTDVGRICKDVAFKTKNIQDAYSGCGDLESNAAARTPYGVAAPPSPSILHERLMLMVCKVSSSFVLKSFRHIGRSKREILRLIPLSSHTCINPIQTA